MASKTSVKEIEEKIKGMDLEEAAAYLAALEKGNAPGIKRLTAKLEKRRLQIQEDKRRLEEMSCYEKRAYLQGHRFIAGIDEAGRGPLAGPVVAAAVILPREVFLEKLNDSKKLTPPAREKLYDLITEKALAYAVGIVDEKCIDRVNILNAARMAMKLALERLSLRPDLLLIDAEKLEDMDIPQLSIVKGDSLSISIAAASIVAKVTRDRIMDQMDALYPQYGFGKHKGYGTREHVEAIKKYGLCPIHRVSFTNRINPVNG